MKGANCEKPIIFFDGVCGLCNGFVDFVLKRDRNRIFLFSPLQGKTAREKFREFPGVFSLQSIVYFDERGLHFASRAIIAIAARLGGFWSFAKIFLLVPAFVRDGIYNRIAENRYRWFGRLDSCRVENGKFADRFLP